MTLEQHFLSKIKEALELNDNPIRFLEEYGFWKQEQDNNMYSEEDLREAFRQGQDNMDYSEMYGWSSKLTEQDWFEQFSKLKNG
jgi:hypothetical protein